MPRTIVAVVGIILIVGTGVGVGQQSGPDVDAVIDTIRDLPTINSADQRRIAEWIQAQVDKLKTARPEEKTAALNAFVDAFKKQSANRRNTAAFQNQFAAQTALIAAAEFAKPDLNETVAWGLARVLLDLENPETLPALLACFQAKAPVSRYLCARGLTQHRDAIAKDKQKLNEVIQVLQSSGQAETSPIALSHIYRALSYPGQVPDVFGAFLSLFDKRLAYRRSAGLYVDGAELEAYEFFRTQAVLTALTDPQKVQLAQRFAVFLRLDAERYALPTPLEYQEQVHLELMLESVEAILVRLVGGNRNPAIAEELAKGGYAKRAEVLAQAYRWVGNPSTKEAGTLNAAPWNVPLGAP